MERRERSQQALDELLSGELQSAPRLPGALPISKKSKNPVRVAPVKIVVRHAELGIPAELTASGNNEDNENSVKSGLLKTDTYLAVYDPSSDTWSRKRGNHSIQLRELAASSASNVSNVGDNVNCRGGHFIINVTAGAAPGNTLTPTIQAQDYFTGLWYTILTGAAINATGITVLKVFPGLGGTPNAIANDVLPRKFRVSYAHSGGAPITYSTTANLVN